MNAKRMPKIEAGDVVLLVTAYDGTWYPAGAREVGKATRATVTEVEQDGRYRRLVTAEFGPLDWRNAPTVYRVAS